MPTPRIAPFPANRVFLGRSILEPAFADDGSSLFLGLQTGPAVSIARMSLASGLLEVITTEPDPAAGVLYGGGLFSVRGDVLVFGARDGRLYQVDLREGTQLPVTPPFGGVGAPTLSPCGRFAAFVAEEGDRASVYLVSLDGSELHRMPDSLPFCCDPVFGPGGGYLAFQTWPGDRMPWDHSELRIVTFHRPLTDCEQLHEAFPTRVTRFERDGVHLAFPLPHGDGTTLLFTSDEGGIRAPWELDLRTSAARPVGRFAGEIGTPNWVQRMMPMAVVRQGAGLVAVSRHEGCARLLLIDGPTGGSEEIPTSCSSISALCAWSSGDGLDRIAYVGASPKRAPALMVREIRRDKVITEESLRVSSAAGIWNADRLAPAEIVRWPTVDGTEVTGILTRAAESARGPLVVLVHGGPTSAAELGWDPTAQYLATRGFPCLSVNHRGSTQRGRAFQDMLRGAWGVVDVEDARTGALAMVERGIADRDRLAVMGSSAGGYTALMCLVTDVDLWAAGISLYGLGDLFDAARGSHRFEQRYQDSLVGPLPQAGAIWRERSPITWADRVRAPVLLFHGADDRAVPCQQSIDFAQAVTRRGGRAELVTFPGEGHGFRLPANRKDVLERTAAFLDKYVRCRQASRSSP